MGIRISSHFDGGNIDVLSSDKADNIRLAIKHDANSDFLQWFYFRLSGARGEHCTLTIENAGDTTYPAGWQDYNVVSSHDLNTWSRIPSRYDGKHLSWQLTPQHDSLYFAYFAPYSLDRHDRFIARCGLEEGVQLKVLGSTLDGRDLDYLLLNSIKSNRPGNARQLWCVGRQHPGEPMASWWMEGFIQRLLNAKDTVSMSVRDNFDIHLVPNMNPDGSFRGHLRTNAAGANLNREWAEPSMERSPEVFLVQQQMKKTGVDLCLDIHGDEALPYNFIAGTEGVESWTTERDEQLKSFKQTLASVNSDFQLEKGYPRNPPGSANLRFCSNSVAQTYKCPAMTLEMPFKDNANAPDEVFGWSPERSSALGSSFVEAIHLRFCS